MLKLKNNLKQINNINKRTLVNLYKAIVLVTRVHFFCATLFTNNNIKALIQMHTFQFARFICQIVTSSNSPISITLIF